MYRLASKEAQAATSFRFGRGQVGGSGFVVIAGPCAVESAEMIGTAARLAAACGADGLRGGAYKPRTSPYSFQGLGDRGVELIASAGAQAQLPAVVEALAVDRVPFLASHVDMIQIGARNMQNFALLRAVAQTGKPVLLKRSASATLDELLYAAEYVLLEGNQRIVLCERGIRGFDPQTRNVFDLAGALRLKELTHLPVIVDPSHASGRASLVPALVLAAAAAGLDGAIVEVHPDPSRALSDADQAIDFDAFESLMRRLQGILRANDVAVAAC